MLILHPLLHRFFKVRMGLRSRGAAEHLTMSKLSVELLACDE